MPFLKTRPFGDAPGHPGLDLPSGAQSLSRLADRWLPRCAGPSCDGRWLRLWRRRTAPVFERGWTCSPRCMQALVASAVQREMEAATLTPREHRHRMPLGLILLSQGWIARAQLASALSRQREAGHGRIGEWLVRESGIAETLITRALSIQWNCPVFSADASWPGSLASLLPRLFLEGFGCLPVRLTGANVLRLGFEDRIDPCVVLAAERMTGLRVIPGLISGTEFRRVQARMLRAAFPGARLLQCADGGGLAATLAALLEEAQPAGSRLVRVHGFLWLRLWRRREAVSGSGPRSADVEDAIVSLVRPN